MNEVAARLPAVDLARHLIASVGLANSTPLIRTLNLARDPSELTPAQVAAEFRVSPSTVRRWEKAKMLLPTRRLPGSGYRRYSRADVEAFKVRLAEQQRSVDGDTTSESAPSES